jgi:hypothetical protein
MTETDDTSGAVGGLTPQTRYTFTVTAVDAAANESPPSSAVSAETDAAAAPPDPWLAHAVLAAALAPRVAAFVGRPNHADTISAATEYIPVVAEYVRGFTRNRGYVADTPAGPLQVVIVAAAARLVANPEQLSMYQTGDYTERPAVLTGYTLAERGVLHRYRRTVA